MRVPSSVRPRMRPIDVSQNRVIASAQREARDAVAAAPLKAQRRGGKRRPQPRNSASASHVADQQQVYV